MSADRTSPVVGALVDDVRALVVAARARGESPGYVMLAPNAYDAVAACRAADRALGAPMILLGLELVRSDDAAAAPRVF